MTIGRSLLAGLTLAGLALASLAGCTSAPKAEWTFRRVSTLSVSHYTSARQRYWESCTAGERGDTRAASMDDVVRYLRAAAQTDDACPLFHSKLGELLIESGALDEAKRSFDDSLNHCDDWPPGWLGLADWALATYLRTRDPAKLDEAEHYLASATEAVEKLDKRFEEKPNRGLLLPGFGRKPEEPEPADGELSSKDQLGLLARWLIVNEAWGDASPTWNTPTIGEVVPMWKPLRLRLKARNLHAQARLAEARGEPADHILNVILDEATRMDQDYIPTQVERARHKAALRDWQGSESILRPIVQGHPLFAADQQAWYAMATLYASWYAQEPSDDRFERAEESFERLHDLNGNHLDGWLAQASLRCFAGRYLKRPDFLEAAQECLNNAKFINAGDPRVARLSEQLRTATAEVEKERP